MGYNNQPPQQEYEKPLLQLHPIEAFVEKMVYNSRYILVPVFMCLIVALFGYAIHFCYMVFDFSRELFTYEKNELLVMVLTFVDKVLVAGLIVMVLIGGYENSVGKLNVSPSKTRLSWLGKVGSSSLKVKLSTAIVSISSIHLLKIFLDIKSYTTAELAWTTGIHFIMVITAILLVLIDKIQGH
ncbi:MAG: TIGR00645 family protein [Alphaproteobacteria bacterium]|nr:TIGR00645 family protein [Alphaproteobacteria bacterium]